MRHIRVDVLGNLEGARANNINEVGGITLSDQIVAADTDLVLELRC